MNDKERKCSIDLSRWNLEEVFSNDWVEERVIKTVAWVVEYVIKDEGKWGFWHEFESVWDTSRDPLDLRISFPVLDEDGGIYMGANLRDFVEWGMLEDSSELEKRKQYRVVANALRSLADEIDNRLITR
jgi:hypothetical protein